MESIVKEVCNFIKMARLAQSYLRAVMYYIAH